MRVLSFLGLFVVTALAGFSGAKAAPGADVYGAKPEVSDATIAPDGAHIALIAAQGGRTAIQIVKVPEGKSCAFAPSGVKVWGAFWANPQRLIVSVSFFFSTGASAQSQNEAYRYVSIDATCQDAQVVLSDFPSIGRVLNGFGFRGRTADGQKLIFQAFNVQDDGAQVGSSIKPRARSTVDLYLVDPATGKSQPFERGTPQTDDWIVDREGRARMRIDVEERSGQRSIYARLGASNDWQPVQDAQGKAPGYWFIAMASKPDTVYVATRNGGDKLAVYEYDLRTKALGSVVYQNPRFDIDNLILDDYTAQAVGVAYTDDFSKGQYFDRDYSQMQADLVATFPGENVEILSVSRDRKKFLALVEGRENPTGGYHYVDMTGAEPTIAQIGARYSAIPAGSVAPVKSFSYAARDGMTIPAYLTLPVGSSGKNLPLVVMPHGGPEARDTASFDPWAQFLASRGYAVLQPQFRGSSGYGAKHLAAGHFRWGLEMQDDITDGVRKLIADGTADASKVCIFGWSYGGYAAMAGMAFTPDLYKCGVAGAGVSDLVAFVTALRVESKDVHLAGKSWMEFLGDPTTDGARLKATSPITNVGKIKGPLLLIHGKTDSVVPFRQSVMMVEEMQRWKKPVEFVEMEGGDHWLSDAQTSQRVLRELEVFLAKNLK